MSADVPMTAWTLHPFLAADIAETKALWAATEGLGVGPGDAPEDLHRFLERNPGLSLLARAEGRIVASVLCGHDGRRGYIYRLAVAPALRRRGLAAELVRGCIEGLRAAGIPRCQVFVEADNGPARDFWASMRGRLRDDLVVFSIDASPGG
jgi:ribosomal protein S18 acetylase RimI-like enzyme